MRNLLAFPDESRIWIYQADRPFAEEDVMKINDEIAIWSAPLELFCEISNEIRERSPFNYTFFFGYSNGWLGYMPTEEEWQYGGYEVERVSPFTPVAGRQLIESVVGYFEGRVKTEAPAIKSEQDFRQRH